MGRNSTSYLKTTEGGEQGLAPRGQSAQGVEAEACDDFLEMLQHELGGGEAASVAEYKQLLDAAVGEVDAGGVADWDVGITTFRQRRREVLA